MTDIDLLLGLLGLIATILTDILALIISLVEPGPKSDILKFILGILDKIFVGSISGLVKWALGTLTGMAAAIRRWRESGGKKPLELTIPPPTPELPSYGIKYDPATGKWTGGFTSFPSAPAPAPSTTPSSPSAPHSFTPFGNSSQGVEDWGHPLDPPDNRSGWAYDPQKGWVMP